MLHNYIFTSFYTIIMQHAFRVFTDLAVSCRQVHTKFLQKHHRNYVIILICLGVLPTKRMATHAWSGVWNLVGINYKKQEEFSFSFDPPGMVHLNESNMSLGSLCLISCVGIMDSSRFLFWGCVSPENVAKTVMDRLFQLQATHIVKQSLYPISYHQPLATIEGSSWEGRWGRRQVRPRQPTSTANQTA